MKPRQQFVAFYSGPQATFHSLKLERLTTCSQVFWDHLQVFQYLKMKAWQQFSGPQALWEQGWGGNATSPKKGGTRVALLYPSSRPLHLTRRRQLTSSPQQTPSNPRLHLQELGLCPHANLGTRTHTWVPAGHSRYAGASPQGGRGWLISRNTGAAHTTAVTIDNVTQSQKVLPSQQGYSGRDRRREKRGIWMTTRPQVGSTSLKLREKSLREVDQ